MTVVAARLVARVDADVARAIAGLKTTQAQFLRTGAAARTMDAQVVASNKRSSGSMALAAKSAKAGAAAAVVAAALSARSAVRWESAFAGVRKTVDGTERDFSKLSSGIRNMSKNIPVAATSLAEIAEQAGALGIEKDSILGFTRVVADMGVATNLVGEEGATALARIANITGMSQKNFERLGSTIVDLGNKGASTEQEIATMGMRIAGAGHQMGMSEAEILSYANALSSVGIEAEAGGSSISRVFTNMSKAARKGGPDLKMIADVAGMTGEQFTKAFEQDAAGATAKFVTGLGDLKKEGKNANDVLEKLGMDDIRVARALLSLAGNSDVLTESLKTGRQAWQENTALSEEARKRYATTASQLAILKNNINDIGISLGNALLPGINAGAKFVSGLLRGNAAMSSMKAQVAGFARDIRQSFGLTSQDFRDFGAGVSSAFNAAMPIIRSFAAGVKQNLRGVAGIIGGLVRTTGALLRGDFAGAFSGLKQIVGGALRAVGGTIRAYSAPFRSAAAGVGRGIYAGLSGGVSAVAGAVSGAFSRARAVLSRFIGILGSAASAAGRAVVAGLQAGLAGVAAVVNAALAPARAAISALSGAISAVKGALSSIKIPSINIPGFAAGGRAPGGMALVGEKGPELVNLPTGSYVHTNRESVAMVAGMDVPAFAKGGRKKASDKARKRKDRVEKRAQGRLDTVSFLEGMDKLSDKKKIARLNTVIGMKGLREGTKRQARLEKHNTIKDRKDRAKEKAEESGRKTSAIADNRDAMAALGLDPVAAAKIKQDTAQRHLDEARRKKDAEGISAAELELKQATVDLDDAARSAADAVRSTGIAHLGAGEALAALTPAIEDDIAAFKATGDFWRGELRTLQNDGIDDALQGAAIGEAATNIKSADDALKGLTETVGDLESQMADLTKGLNEATRVATSNAYITGQVFAQGLADFTSRQISGRVSPTASPGFAL